VTRNKIELQKNHYAYSTRQMTWHASNSETNKKYKYLIKTYYTCTNNIKMIQRKLNIGQISINILFVCVFFFLFFFFFVFFLGGGVRACVRGFFK
jgi:hypothetical protein